MIRKKIGQLRYVKNPLQVWRILTSKVKSIELAINYVCNRRCPGCYARNLREEQKKTFLTPTEVRDICYNYRPAHINLTGGEPMLNPELENIIDFIPKSVIVSMVTNGDLIYDGDGVKAHVFMEKLKKLGLNTIQISYGSNYNTKNNRFLARICNVVGLNVCLSVTNIYKEREHIKKAIELAEEEGYHVLFNTPGCGLEKVFDFQTYFTYRSHPLVREDNMFWAGRDVCGAGTKKFYITADKSIYPCDRMHTKKYDSYSEMSKEYKNKPKVYCRRYEEDCMGETK